MSTLMRRASPTPGVQREAGPSTSTGRLTWGGLF